MNSFCVCLVLDQNAAGQLLAFAMTDYQVRRLHLTLGSLVCVYVRRLQQGALLVCPVKNLLRNCTCFYPRKVRCCTSSLFKLLADLTI